MELSVFSNNSILGLNEGIINDKMIILLEDKIDEIYNNNYDENKSIEDNIKVFHDYIINANELYD